MDANPDVVSVQRLVPASAEAIFDLLVDPTRHPDLDGSGAVRRARRGGRRLGLGDSFGMDMKLGVPYSMRNTVVELEENRRIAWQTRAAPPLDRVVTGRVWGYELEPVDGGTLVRETWDISREAALARPFVRRMGAMTRTNMTRTLERIEALVSA